MARHRRHRQHPLSPPSPGWRRPGWWPVSWRVMRLVYADLDSRKADR